MRIAQLALALTALVGCQQSMPEAGDGTGSNQQAVARQTTQRSSDPTEVLIQEAKQKTLSQIRHPSSAQFRNLAVRGGGRDRAVCGEIDSRGSDGQMTGYRRFAFIDGRIVFYDEEESLRRRVEDVCYECAVETGLSCTYSTDGSAPICPQTRICRDPVSKRRIAATN